MGLKRIGRTGMVAFGLLGAAWAAPAASQGATFCFPNQAVDPACAAPNTNADLQTALTQASQAGGANTLLLGSGTFNLATGTGATVPATDSLQIVGTGRSTTTLAMTDTLGFETGFSFSAPAGSTIRDLSLTIPANQDANGDAALTLMNGPTARNVAITGPDAMNATGVRVGGSSAIDDSTVDLEVSNPQANIGVDESNGSPSITDSVITSDIGVRHSVGGETTTVDRSTIRSSFYAIGGDSGTTVVRNSVIDLGGNAGAVGVLAANFNNGSIPIATAVTGSTIVNGGDDSIGIQAVGDSANPGEDATATVDSTVITGVETPIYVGADNGDSATMTTGYSNYDAAASFVDPDLDDMAPTGTATLNATNQTNLPPGFVSPGAGDYRLTLGSGLRNAGDPAAPLPGETDRAGNPRAFTPGLFTCSGFLPATQRRDIGAYENLDQLPQPAIGCPVPKRKPPKKCKKPKKGKKSAGAAAKKKRKCKPKKKRKK